VADLSKPLMGSHLNLEELPPPVASSPMSAFLFLKRAQLLELDADNWIGQ
jgi:hypothetical protein